MRASPPPFRKRSGAIPHGVRVVVVLRQSTQMLASGKDPSFPHP
jgi:hypothetical protein